MYVNRDILIPMKRLVQEKLQAIELRKNGHSYAQILEQVSVAKSTLSLWLKDLPLTESELAVLQKIKNQRISKGRLRAVAVNQESRAEKQKTVINMAKNTFTSHKNEPLFHTGIALYWAEGAKRNEMWQFVNTDIRMITVMLSWLETYTAYDRSDLGFRLYSHEPYRHEHWEGWWQKQLGVRTDQFKKTMYKPTTVTTKKRPDYKGCLRIEVPKSAQLLLQTKCWINLQVEYYKKE